MNTSNNHIHDVCDQQIIRGYFGLGDHEAVIHVSCDANFLLYMGKKC
jgi:hypothetical protein